MHIQSRTKTFGALACALCTRSGILLVLTAVLSGCGLKGDLYLPEKQAPVVITPAADAATSSSSSSSSQVAP